MLKDTYSLEEKLINIFKLLIILFLISLLKILLNDLKKTAISCVNSHHFSCPDMLSRSLVQCGEAVKVALVVNTCRMCCAGAMRVNLHLRNPHDNAWEPWYHSLFHFTGDEAKGQRSVFLFLTWPKVTQMASSKFRI